MGRWKYSNVCICFDKKTNAESLVRQAMECLGFKKTEDLFLDGNGVNGPEWDNCGDCELVYSNKKKVKTESLFCILNKLFSDVSVYGVTADGDTISDYYSGEEDTFDMSTKMHNAISFKYCYENGTAFGKTVKEEDLDDLEEIGTRRSENEIDLTSIVITQPELVETLIQNADKKGYTELIAIAKKALE